MAAARAALIALALCLAADTGRGESYVFSGEEMAPGTLHALYKFYVYAMDSGDPLAVGGQPYVELSSVVEVPRETLPKESWSSGLKAGDLIAPPAGTPAGFQVSLIPYGKFYSFINPSEFCLGNELLLQSPGAAAHVLSFKVPVRVAADTPAGGGGSTSQLTTDTVRINITRTDVYALVITNCGNFLQQASIHGRVSVTNVFGHMPGDSFYKMGFYGVLTLFYMFLAVMWITSVCCWKIKGKQLHHVHHCISVVLFMSIIESFFTWYFMLDWNRSSKKSETLFILNIMVTVVKPAFSYSLMLITGLGWGVTRPELEIRTVLKVHVIVLLYCFLHVVWEMMSFYRHPYDIATGLLAKVYVAGLLLNAILFVWILRSLGRTSEELEGESRSMFKRVRGLTVMALCVSLPTSALQLMDLAGAITEDLLPRRTAWKWHYQWFLFDGTGQIIFGLVFLGVLCQWAPQNDTNRYMYAVPVDQEDDDEAKDGVVADAPPDAFAIGGRSDDEADDNEVDLAGRRDGGRAQAGPPPDVLGSAAP